MEILTRGERWARRLTGEKIDHVPFGHGLGWYPWGETCEKRKQEYNDPCFNYGAKLGKEVQIDHIHIWKDMSCRQGSLIAPP